ncbi:hypothetical protein PENTCL1PPCAC_17445, partial [Pristionchus entomophagus]
MFSSSRRLSLPQTPAGLPLHGELPRLRPSLPHPSHRSLSSIFNATITTHPIQTAYRHSQPEIRFKDPIVSSTHRYHPHSTPPRTCLLPRRYLKRAPQSDLAYRFQRHHNDLNERGNSSNESTPSRDVDPVYLALKQATARYPAPAGGSRRSSSSHLVDSQTPSPRNLSQVSLQDSGYSDLASTGMYKHGETHSQPRMLGSTPQLDERDSDPPPTSRRRAPKLSKQMKSLSLDCEAPPRVVNGHTRSPARGRLLPRTQAIGRGPNGSGSDLSDWERSCSPGGVHVYGGAPCAPIHSRRASSSAVSIPRAYVVTHEYIPADGSALLLGDRMQIVENGDPDWLHGFKMDDRTEKLYSFPATCVALLRNGEQPMKIVQNVFVADQKLRLYRDQV